MITRGAAQLALRDIFNCLPKKSAHALVGSLVVVESFMDQSDMLLDAVRGFLIAQGMGKGKLVKAIDLLIPGRVVGPKGGTRKKK